MRAATDDDLDSCLRMAWAFSEAAGVESDEASMLATLRTLIDSGGLFVVGDPVCGMAAALVYDNYFNRSRKAAQELFWWVDVEARKSGAGRELLEGLEAWAKDQGAQTMTMIALDDLNVDRVAKMYAVAGYRPLERNFVKRL